MAKGGAIPPASHIVRPTFVLKVCIGCGQPASWKTDRRGRPFHYCGLCGLRIFIYHPTSMTGLEVVHQLVMRAGVLRFRQTVASRVLRRQARVPVTV